MAMKARLVPGITLALAMAIGATPESSERWAAAPAPQARPSTPAVASPHTQMLAQGWTALSNGDFGNAARIASQVLGTDSKNLAALALAVEADIVGVGAAAGLTVYEQWLGNRKIEDAYAIRRVAVAFLREAAANPPSRVDALKALAADGDADAAAALAAGVTAGRYGETAALASLGDAQAARALIAQLASAPGNKGPIIDALSRTRSPEAIPPLVALLDDPNDDTKAAAADALGKLNAVQAADRLRKMVDDPQLVYLPLKWKAASALCRMKDATCLGFFRRVMASQQAQEYPQLKVDAAADMALFGNEAEWIDEIRPLVAHPDPQVRARAAVLIAPYDNATARNALVGLLQDPNPAIRELVARDLAAKVAADFATLRFLLRSADAMTRIHAAGRILELTR
jgi:HEAT repeat protein